MGLFIQSDKLKNLKHYKYSAEDHSIISRYILKKWWYSFEKVFPIWLAPNVITLLGLVFILCNVFCVFYFDPYLSQTSPRWCYFFYAFGLFMYQTFDGCDGCHARRTGQSGPLGELFDHSIDAINTTLSVLVFASVLKMGYGFLLFASQFASVCNFYASTWEEYHTNTLYLSEFSGPVEGILMIVFIYLLTGIFGPDIWNIELFDLNLSSLGYNKTTTINTSICYVIAGLCSLYFNIKATMENVNKYYKSANQSNPEKATQQTYCAYRGLIPFFTYYGTIVLFIFFYPEIIYDYVLPLVASIGLTIAFSVGRIISAHLTLQEFPIIQYPMFLPIVQLILSKVLINFFKYDYNQVLLAISWLGFGITLGIHGMFVTDIIHEITSYLDIYVLSIKYKVA